MKTRKILTRRLLLWIAGSLVAVIAIAGVALVVLFPADEMRLLLEKRASVELGRPVSVGSVGVSLWGGLGALVSDVRVGDSLETEGDGLSAKVESIDIKVEFWPLLQGEYVVERLIVQRPEIRIWTGSDESGRGSDSDDDVAGAKLALGGLSFGKLEIRDGFLKRLDNSDGSSVTVAGFDFEGDLTESVAEKLFLSSGSVGFESATFGSGGDEPIEIPAVSIDYSVMLDGAFEKISIAKADISVGAGRFSLQGEVPLNVGGGGVDGDGDGALAELKFVGGAPLGFLMGFVPGNSASDYSGDVKIDLAIEGNASSIENAQLEGSLVVSDGAMLSDGLSEKLEDFDVELLIFPDSIEINKFAAQFSESDFSLSGIISNPFPFLLPVSQEVRDNSVGPRIQFELSSRYLNVDGLFPVASPGTGESQVEGAESGESVSSAPIFLPEMNGSGTVEIDSLIYAGVVFSDVKTNVRIERRRIFCDDAKGHALGGDVDGNVLVDLTDIEKPHYSGDYAAHSVNAAEFVNRMTPWIGSGLLSGEMSTSGSYDASGWRKEEFIAGLTMDILSNADSLSLTSETLSKALSSGIMRASGKAAPDALLNESFKTFDLRSFKSRLRFVDGKLRVDTLKGFSSEIGSWNLRGAVGVDGGLKLSGDLFPTKSLISSLTPKNSLAGAVAGFLKNAPEGSIRIPFTISGSAKKPVFGLNTEALSKALGNTLKKEGANILKGLFKKR